jgi:hypothetical protein
MATEMNVGRSGAEWNPVSIVGGLRKGMCIPPCLATVSCGGMPCLAAIGRATNVV